MPKMTKHAEQIDRLFQMTKKAAERHQSLKQAEPHASTKAMVNSFEAKSTEQKDIDQNAVKPENNTPQGIAQKPGKAAAELDAMADGIFDALKSAGEPHDSTKAMVNSTDAESTKQKDIDQNAVKPENNTPQGIDQKPGKAAAEVEKEAKAATTVAPKTTSAPAAAAVPAIDAKTAAQKIASYDFGRQVAAALFAGMTKSAAEISNIELLKTAGKRDMENIIAAATEELSRKNTKQASASEADLEKMGAEYFKHVEKKASEDIEKEELTKKIAALEAKLNEVGEKTKVAEVVKEKFEAQEKQAKENDDHNALVSKLAAALVPMLKEAVAKDVIATLKSESAR